LTRSRKCSNPEGPKDSGDEFASDAGVTPAFHLRSRRLRRWLQRSVRVPFIATQAIGQPGDWRMVPLHANGQLAVAAYHLDDRHSYHPFAIVVLASSVTHLTRITLFAEPALFSRLGLPT
jgi:hypothetical protein